MEISHIFIQFPETISHAVPLYTDRLKKIQFLELKGNVWKNKFLRYFCNKITHRNMNLL